MICKELYFTDHLLKRMAKRGMSKAIIHLVVGKGQWRKGKEPFSYEVEYKGVIVILYEQKSQFNVSTCKLNRELTCRAEQLKKDTGMDFWKAVHKVVKTIDFEEDFAGKAL